MPAFTQTSIQLVLTDRSSLSDTCRKIHPVAKRDPALLFSHCNLQRAIGILCTMDNVYCVYILANKRNGTLYTGSTGDLPGRIFIHKNDSVDGFTKKYGVHRLVYYEACGSRYEALQRERQIKEWKRSWKLALIEKVNPEWRDLYDDLFL